MLTLRMAMQRTLPTHHVEAVKHHTEHHGED
jgi:hypothetical protein